MCSGGSSSTARVIHLPHGMRGQASFLLFALLAACAHSGAFDGSVLHKGDLVVRVGPVPGEWRVGALAGPAGAGRDGPHDGSTLFDVRCDGRDRDAPLGVLTEHLIMGTTERDFTSQETVPFDRREALHTLMRAKLDG